MLRRARFVTLLASLLPVRISLDQDLIIAPSPFLIDNLDLHDFEASGRTVVEKD